DDNHKETASLLGGDGSGGAYNWSLMDDGPAVPDLSHRQAIGRLLHDAGISVNMSYETLVSGTDTMKVADALKNTFGYSNAIKGYNNSANIPSTVLNNMTNPNLDAGYPVIFGISNGTSGHAIVGDGYGYNSSTLYHHMNMGWGGSQDAWYNLPTILGYTSVYKTVYNVYTTGSGEIISGRVTDSSGNPINGASVTAVQSGGGTYSATTNAKGIYALAKIPSASTYTVSVTASGYSFSDQTVSTLASTDYISVGNKWGVNFVGSGSSNNNNPTIVPILLPLLLKANTCQDNDVVGEWDVWYDWYCDGGPWMVQYQVNNDHTFSTGEGYDGTWALSGQQITFDYGTGTIYVGTFNASCSSISGTMTAYTGNTGCFTASRANSETTMKKTSNLKRSSEDNTEPLDSSGKRLSSQ
ncbi:MAG: hypothetical protein D3910_21960, partial [Candidatus Electrothrix sp. ATG2]|nr:hypothetical protein [Candidatus Electrothrix sp. ATG2]